MCRRWASSCDRHYRMCSKSYPVRCLLLGSPSQDNGPALLIDHETHAFQYLSVAIPAPASSRAKVCRRFRLDMSAAKRVAFLNRLPITPAPPHQHVIQTQVAFRTGTRHQDLRARFIPNGALQSALLLPYARMVSPTSRSRSLSRSCPVDVGWENGMAVGLCATWCKTHRSTVRSSHGYSRWNGQKRKTNLHTNGVWTPWTRLLLIKRSAV